MPSKEDIDQQRKLLETHRRALAHLLEQVANYGKSNAPLSILNNIDDARDNIRRVKGTLRGWGAPVENHPDDEEVLVSVPPALAEQRALLIKQASLSLQFILTHETFAHKYVYDLYVERKEAEELFQGFLSQSQQRCYVISGQAGKGKTFMLCHLAKSLDHSESFVPVLLNSTTLERLNLTDAILEQLGPALPTAPYQPDFKTLVECLCTHNVTLVVFIDAINELEGDENRNAFESFSEQLNALLRTVAANRYPVLFCISCRSEFWTHFSAADWATRDIFEPLGLKLPTHELTNFGEEQIDAIKQRYFRWYALEGELLPSARKNYCDPIMWYYLCTAFTARKNNREDPKQIERRSVGEIRTLQRKEVFDRFVVAKRQALVKATRGLAEEWSDFDLTTRYLIWLAYEMCQQGRSYITTEEVIRIARKLKHYDATLKNRPGMRSFLENPDSIFFKLIDEGILIKRDRESYQFVFETYFEFSLGRYIAFERWYKLVRNKKRGPAAVKDDLSKLLHEHAQLVETKNFTNLFGALQFAILLTEDHRWYHEHPTLYIELIQHMSTFSRGGFTWIQQSCAVIRETTLAQIGTWEKLQNPAALEAAEVRFAGLLSILDTLTLKTDFVILWDVENTLYALAEAHFRRTLQHVRHWATKGERLQPFFATQTLTRLSAIRPGPVVDLLVDLAQLSRYSTDFWLARMLLFTTLRLAQRQWEDDLSPGDRAQIRKLVCSFAQEPTPAYTRGAALATLPFLSQHRADELQWIDDRIDAETWPWALWNLAYELQYWPEEWPHDWVWNTLDKLAQHKSPHVRYAVDYTARMLAPHSQKRATRLDMALAGNRWRANAFEPEPVIAQPGLTGIAYSPAYLAPSYDNHVECRERVQAILEKLLGVGGDAFNWLDPRDDVAHLLQLAHNEQTDRHRNGAPWPTYVQDVRRGYELLAQRSESNHGAIGPRELRYESYEAALLSVGGAVRAVDYVLDGPARAAWSLGRPPGHLANNAICIFNNIAIAARYAQERLRERKRPGRVLVVDCDAHHGIHTNKVFLDDPSVIYFSLHIDGEHAHEGQVEHIGKGAGEGYNFNLPYPPFMGDAGYSYIVNQLLIPVAREFRPELLMISAGFDGHFDDPLTPECILSERAYRHLAERLCELAEELEIKIVGVLEGGYGLEGLASSFVHVVSAIGRWSVAPEVIGFMPLPATYADRVDPQALGKVEALVRRRVELMAEVKRRNPAYTFDTNQPHWQALLADQGQSVL